MTFDGEISQVHFVSLPVNGRISLTSPRIAIADANIVMFGIRIPRGGDPFGPQGGPRGAQARAFRKRIEAQAQPFWGLRFWVEARGP